MKFNNMDIDEMRSLLDYQPQTGEITWKVARGPRKAGQSAGKVTYRGYLSICINYRYFTGSRVAFALHFGRWPDGDVDHKNRDRTDNRLCNLRECSHAENNLNRAAVSHSISGIKNVHWSAKKQRWRVRVTVAGATHYGGEFECVDAARTAALELRSRLHGEFANHS